jgi:hypothetical protein
MKYTANDIAAILELPPTGASGLVVEHDLYMQNKHFFLHCLVRAETDMIL